MNRKLKLIIIAVFLIPILTFFRILVGIKANVSSILSIAVWILGGLAIVLVLSSGSIYQKKNKK